VRLLKEKRGRWLLVRVALKSFTKSITYLHDLEKGGRTRTRGKKTGDLEKER